MHALVTGGGGFLGLHLVEQLVARGDRVRAFCRGDYPRLRALGVEVVRGDLRDRAAVTEALRGIDVAFHAAALPGIWGPWRLFHETNTLGTQHVLEGCRTHRVPKLVHTSTPSVVFDGHDHEGADEALPYASKWLCHYPHSKALAERAVLEANGRDGLHTVALRPHLVWGPRDNHLIPRLIDRARSGRLRRVGPGTNRVSVSYVENVAAAHLQAADALGPDARCAGRAYFVNEPEPVNLWNWIDELLGRAGLPPVKKSISRGAARRIGAACELAWTALRLRGEPPMTRFLAAQLGGSHWYRADAAARDFDCRAIVSIDEGLRRMTPELVQAARR